MIALNLAIAYARQGARTLLMDADFGMADLNLLLGVAPNKSLADVVLGTPMEDVLVASNGIHLLPALNGSDALENMDESSRNSIFSEIERMGERFDTLLVDVAAGVGSNQTIFSGAVPDTVIVVTPEPLSLADAYASLKVLTIRQGLQHAFIVANKVRSDAEAQEVVIRLSSLVAQFLDVSLSPLPPIPYDPVASEAAVAGVPLLSHCPDAPASRAIVRVARKIDALTRPDRRRGAVRLYWRSVSERSKEKCMSAHAVQKGICS